MKINQNRVKEGICQWAKANLLLLVCILITRAFFLLQVTHRVVIEAASFSTVASGIVFDFLLVCHIATWLLVPFLLFYCFWPNTTFKTYTGLTVFFSVVSALLTEYFCNLMMPLDHVIFVYSPEEVMGTLTSSAHFTAAPFIWFLLTMAVVVAAMLLWKKMKVPFIVAASFSIICIAVSVFVNYTELIRSEKHYKDHKSFCLAVNQPSYSAIKICDYFANKNESLIDAENNISDEVKQAFKEYHSLNPQNKYVDANYPLWRIADDKDVLGCSLRKTTDSLPPNFVFIIIESFGQKLSGVDYPAFSATPFIDSLKHESLYWKNCMSSAERTFGVLPAIFASVPQGKIGFQQVWTPMPSHNSLLKDLKVNGYETSYYYGGVHSFDRYDNFLKANDVDFVFLPQIDNVDSATYKILNDNHRWGLDDNEVFDFARARKNEKPSNRPNLDIYMTLTTHEPFVFGEVDAYKTRIEELLKQHTDMSDAELQNVSQNLNIFACYNYVDECVRKLLNYYKTLPEYENTIFIITGDHRMAFIPFGTSIHNYNVPLLIFSPMLKEHKSMNAVVSHLDITPTIEAYLHENYGFEMDECCHWIGNSLDTTSAFRNTRKLAFMLNNRDVVDYYEGDYYLSNNKVFVTDSNFVQQYVYDDSIAQMMIEHLNNYSTVSHFTVQHDFLKKNDKLLPILSLSLDFDNESNSIFSEYLKKDGGNISVQINETTDYGPICPQITIPLDAVSITVELTMDLQSHDVSKDLPSLVFQSEQYYASLSLTDDNGNSLNTGNWEHFYAKSNIAVSEDMYGAVLKVFLFNSQHTEMEYDNLKVNVSYEIRKMQ